MLASLIRVNKDVFLAASAFNGVGASLLWTSEVCRAERWARRAFVSEPHGRLLFFNQGNAITLASSPATRGRNSGKSLDLMRCVFVPHILALPHRHLLGVATAVALCWLNGVHLSRASQRLGRVHPHRPHSLYLPDITLRHRRRIAAGIAARTAGEGWCFLLG